ncbi:MAG: DMT family transporter [Chloroflexota bacterium]
MLIGFLFGLVSAVANGSSNILGAVAARRAGVLIAPMAVLTIALVFMAMFAWATGLSFVFDLDDMPLLVTLGAMVALGFSLFYKALQLGPVSVVSSITATSGAASVVFAVILLGEHPSLLQWMAVPVSTLGAVLATRARRLPDATRGAIGRGPVYAALTVLTGGCSNALIRIPIVEHGPVQAVVVQRFFTVVFIVLLVAGAALLRRHRSRRLRTGEDAPGLASAPVPRPRERGGWRATVALLVLMGAIDGTGFIGFAFGMAVAPAWLLGLVSQSGRLAAAFVATAVFRENLRPIQWFGIGLVAVGLVLAVAPI